MDLPPLSFHASLEEQWDEEEEPEGIATVLKVVPPAYHQYLDVFSNVKAEKSPPHHAYDHHIELEGLLPPVGVIYSLSIQESETMLAYISENVEKGFIRPSSSSTGEPVLFVKKKDGGPCLCVDYGKLNAVTTENRYPVPPMNQLLTIFNSSTIFSKIDLCGAYNLLRIKEGDEHLTAFRTKYGSYEYLVMPFGLTNAPASLQNLLNDIFADFLDIFVVVYLDDIMVFSSSEEEHVKHVASVLQRLRDNILFAKASKCVFHDSNVGYLGYVVSSVGLKMDSSKFQQTLNWPQPKNIKALQYFLGFANFYRRFIKNYSKKITSLTSLLKKNSPFIFNEEALSQFQELKEAFASSPILSHFNNSLPTIVETDASDYALGAVLSQVNDSGKHPNAFDSCKLFPAELNYKINDKELLGIVRALNCWRAFLLSLSNPFEVLKDQSSLQYFMSSKVLTCCRACWAEFLSEFHFTISYFQGRLATLPDAFSNQESVWTDREGKSDYRTVSWMYVWLASKNLKTTRPTKKLSGRWLGPFQVFKNIGSHAYHLKLPQQLKSVHPVFHVSLLEPVKKSSIPNCNQLPPPPVLVEDKEEWEVAQVLNSKLKRGQLWYLVELKGFSEDPERTTWEPASNLTRSPDLVNNFHSFHPANPGPNTSEV
ncbi:hypothetical protein O181_010797 [Austropuccinia psidii MF-1]|uniref:Chromo domain-containing protein n=1 Tax=Austropuccinia psidii MF-1 TaxID=1389203 RepID=A0A9Q3BTD8_9BASI|nr:hypothetical protein [Austropuccinia psidii MF-1]